MNKSLKRIISITVCLAIMTMVYLPVYALNEDASGFNNHVENGCCDADAIHVTDDEYLDYSNGDKYEIMVTYAESHPIPGGGGRLCNSTYRTIICSGLVSSAYLATHQMPDGRSCTITLKTYNHYTYCNCGYSFGYSAAGCTNVHTTCSSYTNCPYK